VLDHLGLKSGKDVREAQNFATLDNVLALARRPNVAAKVSAMPCYADDKTYPFRSVHPHIRRVFDAFGPKRTFWGTDWSRLPCSLPAGRHHVHRGDALAEGRGPRRGDGPRQSATGSAGNPEMPVVAGEGATEPMESWIFPADGGSEPAHHRLRTAAPDRQ
jgi:hypothetical protein